LQKSGGFRIEDAARDVEVGNRVTIEQHISALKIKQEGKNRNAGCKPGQKPNLGVPDGTHRRALHFLGHKRLSDMIIRNGCAKNS
jgi:hypothetical protein